MAVLGVKVTDTWADVRRAFRATIRARHPDTSAEDNANASAARVTEAYALLRREWHQPGTAPPPVTPTRVDSPERETEDRISLIGTDTIVVPAPGGEAFARLVDAAHSLGEVSYIDRASGFLEVVVTVLGGPACSVVVSVQGRATGDTEAFVTIEPLGRGPAPPVEPFAAALAALVAQRWP